MRALLTRCQEDADQLAKLLDKRKVSSLIAPMLEIVIKEKVELDFTNVQALLFTSTNGVRGFVKNSDKRDLKVFAVGDSTARAAKDAGFADVETASGNVETLAEYVKTKTTPSKGAFLHPAAGEVAGDLSGMLKEAGMEVRRVVLYNAQPITQLPSEVVGELKEGKLNFVLFFSPRTAETFSKLVEEAGLVANCGKLTALCLSQAVADKLSLLNFAKVIVSDKPDQDSLLSGLDSLMPKKSFSLKMWLFTILTLLILGSGAGVYFTQDIWKPALLAKINGLLGSDTPNPVPALALRISKLEQELAAIKAQAQGSGPDNSKLEAKLGQLEQEITKLYNRPAPLVAPQTAHPSSNNDNHHDMMVQNIGDLAAKLAWIEANAARASDLLMLSEKVSRLEIGQKELNTNRENSALLLFTYSNLREAVLRGGPFASELKILLGAAAGQTLTGEALLTFADKGVPTIAVLRQSLGDIKLTKDPAKEGDIWQGILGNLENLVRVKKIDGGQGLLAAIEQAKAKLDARDIGAAINIIAAEKGVNSANWLNAAQSRLDGEKALTALGNQILALAAKKEK